MTKPKAAEPLASMGASEMMEPPAEPQPALFLDLQYGPLEHRQRAALPDGAEFERWALAALAPKRALRPAVVHGPAELTIRITNEAESAELNQRYRRRSGPTNILSFPFEPPPGLDPEQAAATGITALLGDLVICAPLVRREAAEQGKAETAHWAHLVVHGVLHLLGFDHLTATEAAPMEALEITILAALGFSTPYEVNDDANGERRRI